MSEPIVISGWGQVTQPKAATPPFLEPIDMMERAALAAGALAGTGVLQSVDTFLVVRTQSRTLVNPGDELARRLGARPKSVHVSGIGGEVPQQFVNRAAGMLARGEAETILICGAETYYPRSADAVRGEQALIQGVPADYDADDAVGSSALEQRHGLTLPIHGFPLFETALWAQSGLRRAQWLARIGGMWAGFSEVAARHPNAWTRRPFTAEEITTPSGDNRPIASPYTKRMVSLVMADLGAAIVVTTARRAASAHGGGARPVYFIGGGFAKDRQRFMADKSDFTRSPALAQAAARAEARAGMRVADVECFDLYSCFPSAVSVARKELGLSDGDPRPLTLTGGLCFFGGPGSNYALHGIATMAETIAAGRRRSGMTTALGWFMHKYAVGIYAATPNGSDASAWDREDEAHPEAGGQPTPAAEHPEGRGRIETYTVTYGRDHRPTRALIYGRTADGERFVANTAADASAFAELTEENQVGRAVRLSTVEGLGRAELE
jgi:acetyl-CoA C-acetyltransferase